MKIDLLDKTRLEILNKRGLRYNLQDAQKDYFLAIMLHMLYDSGLKESLVFKGGTAIYHCYAEQLRFSKGLDFTSKIPLKAGDVEKIFSDSGVFKLKNVEEKKYSLDFTISYNGFLAQSDSIDVNININQKVLRKPKIMEYRNNYGVPLSCLTMDQEEIFAEKIRTLNERARPRDSYDLAILSKRFKLNAKDGVKLLLKKELHRPLDKKSMEENIKISLERFDAEMKELYYQPLVTKDDIIAVSNEILKAIGLVRYAA